MKNLLTVIILLSSISSFASLEIGISAVLKTLENQQIIYRPGQKDEHKCTLEIFSNSEDHIAVYIEDIDGNRYGVATGFTNPNGIVSFQPNKFIIEDSIYRAIITLNDKKIMKKVEIRKILPMGSYLKTYCEF